MGTDKVWTAALLVIGGADHTLFINGFRGILRRGLRNRPVSLELAADWAAQHVAE